MKKFLITSLLVWLYSVNSQAATDVEFETGEFDGFSNEYVTFHQNSGSADIRGNVVYLGSTGSFTIDFNFPAENLSFRLSDIGQSFRDSLDLLTRYAPGSFEASFLREDGFVLDRFFTSLPGSLAPDRNGTWANSPSEFSFSLDGSSLASFGDFTFDKVVIDYIAPTYFYHKIVGDSADGNKTSVFALYQSELILEQVSYQLSGNPTTPVPEPETYAMMFAGLGLIGFMKRGRLASRRSAKQRIRRA